jgi:hypothetical protein
LDGPATELIRALWVGVRFDLRLAVFIIVPVGLFFMIPFINPLRMAISNDVSEKKYLHPNPYHQEKNSFNGILLYPHIFKITVTLLEFLSI